MSHHPHSSAPNAWTRHRVPQSGVACYAFTPNHDSNVLVLGDKLGNIMVGHVAADTITGKSADDALVFGELFTLDGHQRREITSLAFTPDGKTLLSSDSQGQAVLWLSSGWEQVAGNRASADEARK